MRNKCKHKPKNIFGKKLICKKCGKRITYNIPYASAFVTFTMVCLTQILNHYVFQDLSAYGTAKLNYFFISLVISVVCVMGIIQVIGYKEDTLLSIDEINVGIKKTFNSVLYYHGNDDKASYITSNKNIILNKDLEYELYFESNSKSGLEHSVFLPKIHFVITNLQHPLSSEGTQLLYAFGIDITERGLQSEFSYQGYWPQSENNFIGNELSHLGSYTMRIEEIEKPAYETMSVKWKENAKNAIRSYMDLNKFYEDKSVNLEPGNYHIYIQKFFRTDEDSIIIFENENGSIYTGHYYFVHDISASNPGDLNEIVLEESSNEKSFETYLEKVKLDPALAMEYAVK